MTASVRKPSGTSQRRAGARRGGKPKRLSGKVFVAGPTLSITTAWALVHVCATFNLGGVQESVCPPRGGVVVCATFKAALCYTLQGSVAHA